MNRVLDTRERSSEYSEYSEYSEHSNYSEYSHYSEAPSSPPEPVAEAPAHISGSSRLQGLLDELGGSKWAIATPGMVFDALCRHLGIRTGALLIRDSSDNAFRPWAHAGLDPTTASRLTMTRGQLNALVSGFLETYRPDNSAPLLPFLSFRESSALAYAILLRLRFRGRLAGMLLILDADIFQMEPESREIMLSALSEPVAREIIEQRDAVFDRMYTPLILEQTDFRRSVRNISEDIDSASQALVVLRVDLRPMQTASGDVAPFGHARRTAEDIRSVSASLLGGTGDLCAPNDHTLICVSLVPTAENGDMLINELGDKLRQFFPVLSATHVPPCRRWLYPAKDKSIDTILQEAFTES